MFLLERIFHVMKWWKFPTTPVRSSKISALTVPVNPRIELTEDTPYASIVNEVKKCQHWKEKGNYSLRQFWITVFMLMLTVMFLETISYLLCWNASPCAVFVHWFSCGNGCHMYGYGTRSSIVIAFRSAKQLVQGFLKGDGAFAPPPQRRAIIHMHYVHVYI